MKINQKIKNLNIEEVLLILLMNYLLTSNYIDSTLTSKICPNLFNSHLTIIRKNFKQNNFIINRLWYRKSTLKIWIPLWSVVKQIKTSTIFRIVKWFRYQEPVKSKPQMMAYIISARPHLSLGVYAGWRSIEGLVCSIGI